MSKRRKWKEGTWTKTTSGKHKLTCRFGIDKVTGKAIRKTFTAATPDGCLAKKKEYELLLSGGINIEISETPLKDYLPDWVATNAVKKKMTASTVQEHSNLVSRIIESHGHIKIGEVTPRHLDQLLQREGKPNRPAEGRKSARFVSAKMTYSWYALLKQIMTSAKKQSHIINSPFDRHEQPAVPSTDEARVLSREEAKYLWEKIGSDLRVGRITQFILQDTGARIGETLALTWKDCDLDSDLPRLRIQRTVKYVHGEVAITSGKTAAAQRWIELSPRQVENLKAQKVDVENMKLNCMYDGKQWEENDLVFPDKRGRHIQATAHVGILHKKLSEHYCDLMPEKNDRGQRIGWHTFRHTYATLVVIESRDWLNLSKRLGHTSPAITMKVYAHYIPDSQHEVKGALDHIFA